MRTPMHKHAHACEHLHMRTPTSAYACAHPCLSVCTPKPAHVHTHAHVCMCTCRYTLCRCCFSGGCRVDHLMWWIGATLNTSARCEQPPPRKGQAISTTEVSGSIHNGLTGGCYLTTIHRTLYMPVLGILCSEESGRGSGRAEYPVRSRFRLSQAPHYIFSSNLELN